MKFSDYFNLQPVQGSFEFFDIDIEVDTKNFVDPYYIVRDKSLLGIQMTRSITGFMHQLLLHVRSDDLQQSSLVCEGIGKDIISDITISLVKLQLIEFTNKVCQKYSIPVKTVSEKITYYCNINNEWKSKNFELPHVIDNGVESYLILIPEKIVPEKVSYNHSLFYSNIAIPIYKEIAIKEKRPYVAELKSGEKKVYSKDIRSDLRFKGKKSDMIDFINDNPETLMKYRQQVADYRYRKDI